jgi:hypothetical protein
MSWNQREQWLVTKCTLDATEPSHAFKVNNRLSSDAHILRQQALCLHRCCLSHYRTVQQYPAASDE